MDEPQNWENLEINICPWCDNIGIVYFEYDDIIGYVSADMANDAGDITIVGQPIYGKVKGQEYCVCDFGQFLKSEAEIDE